MNGSYTVTMLCYAITNRSPFSGTTSDPLDALVRQASRWAQRGIDFIQIREKDLQAAELAGLVRRVVEAVHAANASTGFQTKVLVNSRADVAVAAGAEGVHLTSAAGELTAGQIRQVFAGAGRSEAVVSVSCHTLEEVARASASGVGAILFGPVFEKPLEGTTPLSGVGLDALRAACAAAGGTPVYALGGVTDKNAPECIVAGASGIAGIRLFLDR